MSEKKVRAILSSQHYSNDPRDAPDRMFTIRPQETVSGYGQKEAIISDVHDDERYIVDSVENYRSRTDSPGGDIEILIDARFFGEENRKHAAYLLWLALNNAHDRLSCSN